MSEEELNQVGGILDSADSILENLAQVAMEAADITPEGEKEKEKKKKVSPKLREYTMAQIRVLTVLEFRTVKAASPMEAVIDIDNKKGVAKQEILTDTVTPASDLIPTAQVTDEWKGQICSAQMQKMGIAPRPKAKKAKAKTKTQDAKTS